MEWNGPRCNGDGRIAAAAQLPSFPSLVLGLACRRGPPDQCRWPRPSVCRAAAARRASPRPSLSHSPFLWRKAADGAAERAKQTRGRAGVAVAEANGTAAIRRGASRNSYYYRPQRRPISCYLRSPRHTAAAWRLRHQRRPCFSPPAATSHDKTATAATADGKRQVRRCLDARGTYLNTWAPILLSPNIAGFGLEGKECRRKSGIMCDRVRSFRC